MRGTIGRQGTKWAMAAGALLVATAVAAQADTRPVVAVWSNFTNGATGDLNKTLEPLTVGIPELLIDELGRNAKIRVVERSHVKELLEEQNLGASGRADPNTAARVGKLLGARHIILGGFVITPDGQTRLTARAVNVETGVVEFVTSAPGDEKALMTLITALADQLNAGLKLPPLSTAARDTMVNQAKKVPLQATLYFSHAMTAKDEKNTAQAVQYLQKALAEFPQFEQAQQELKKLQPASGTE